MLVKDIGRVTSPEKAKKTKVFSCNLLANGVTKEDVMTFLKLGIRDDRALDHRIVVFKHVSTFVDWDSAAT